jgi:lipoprotein-anchoring transpeptidase ErfK/SrfK
MLPKYFTVPRSVRPQRPLVAACAALIACAAFAAAGPAPASTPTAPAARDGVSLVKPVWVRVRPSSRSRIVGQLFQVTPFSFRRTVLPVLERAEGRGGTEWVRVPLGERPNGSSGWVPRWVTRRRPLEWAVRVDLSDRRARIYRDGRLVRNFRVVVGAKRTPTPRGRFYIMDRVKLSEAWARGTWAFATSAFSTVHFHFAGGRGQIAMHARGSLSAPLGTASSTGCIRFANGDIAWLIKRLPLGTPLEIVR